MSFNRRDPRDSIWVKQSEFRRKGWGDTTRGGKPSRSGQAREMETVARQHTGVGVWDRAAHVTKESVWQPVAMADGVQDWATANNFKPLYMQAMEDRDEERRIMSGNRGQSGSRSPNRVGFAPRSLATAESGQSFQKVKRPKRSAMKGSGAAPRSIVPMDEPLEVETGSPYHPQSPPAATDNSIAYRIGAAAARPSRKGSLTHHDLTQALRPDNRRNAKGGLDGFYVNPAVQQEHHRDAATLWEPFAESEIDDPWAVHTKDYDSSGDEQEAVSKAFVNAELDAMEGHAAVTRDQIARSMLTSRDPGAAQEMLRERGVVTNPDGTCAIQHGPGANASGTLQLCATGGKPKSAPNVRPVFSMPTLPPRPEEEFMSKEQRDEQESWRWQWVEKGYEVPLTLLLLRNVEPRRHTDLVTHHMHPDLLRDVSELMKGAYLSKFDRHGGPAHERYFQIQMASPTTFKSPVPMLQWKIHANASTITDRVDLSWLVGVSFDADSSTFQQYKVLSDGTKVKDLVAHQYQAYLANVTKAQQQYAQRAHLHEQQTALEIPPFQPRVPNSTKVFLRGPMVGGGKHQYLYQRNAFTLWFLDRKTMMPHCVDVCAYDRPTATMWVTVFKALCAINSIVISSKVLPEDDIVARTAISGNAGPNVRVAHDGSIVQTNTPQQPMMTDNGSIISPAGSPTSPQMQQSGMNPFKKRHEALVDGDEVENQEELCAFVKRELHRYAIEGDPLLAGFGEDREGR